MSESWCKSFESESCEMSQTFVMPSLGRQVADIPAYVSYHGLDDYISFTNTKQSYDELYADPTIEQAENGFQASQNAEIEPPKMERQIGQHSNYVFAFGVEAYKKNIKDSRTIEEILECKDMKEANDLFKLK